MLFWNLLNINRLENERVSFFLGKQLLIMPRSHKEVEILIIKLEHSLCKAKLWSNQIPSENAMQSMVPFAFDSMPFEQWLQFIFIPKMLEIVLNQKALPNSLCLTPMAEQSLGVRKENREVVELIKQIDLVFGAS